MASRADANAFIRASSTPTGVRKVDALAYPPCTTSLRHARLVLPAAQATGIGVAGQAALTAAKVTCAVAALRLSCSKGPARVRLSAWEVVAVSTASPTLPPLLPASPTCLTSIKGG